MEKMSVRLLPEISKKLQSEARKMGEATGENVTVSDLIRACIGEKFPQICARVKGETAAILALQDEVATLSQDVERLVKTLSDVVPLLATREQVDALTDAIADVIRATKER